MPIYFIVVADSSRARLLSLDRGSGELEELECLTHPKSHQRERELDADKPGRHAGGMSGSRHGLDREDKSRDHESDVFARQICALLESGRTAGKYEGLILIAPPKFLGALRACLSPPCGALVIDSIPRNLVHAGDAAILDHVSQMGSES